MNTNHQFIIGVFLLMSVACSSPQETGFKRLSTEAFAGYIQNNNVQLVDIRTEGETSQGIIEGALVIDFYSPEFLDKIEALDKSRPIAIYCASGGRSAKAATQIQTMNFESIVELKEGYKGWVYDGFPVK